MIMEQKSNLWRTPSICIVLILATVGVYWQVHEFGFVSLDDHVYVSGNEKVLGGLTWDGFKWAFKTTKMGNWHPVTWLSLMLDG
jgi:hypothetical protein